MNVLKNAASFNEHVNAILAKFDQNYVWSDKDKSRLAMFVVDALAGTSEVNQGYIVFALREAFIRKARRSSSVLAGARFLGQSLNRRTGSAMLVTLRNNSTVTKTIPAFSQFTVSSLPFYSAESVSIPAGQTRKVMFKQGTVELKQFDLSSVDLDFPEIILGIPGFNVSMEDLYVYTENPGSGMRTEFRELNATIFEAKLDDPIYIHSSTDVGDVSLVFGNGRFGQRLNATDRLVVRYVLTSGASGNIGSPGQRVRMDTDDTISGVTDEPSVGGSEPQDADEIKMYAPHIFESHDNLVRQDHWEGNIADYPDVADVVVQGQRDIDPDDPSWMNVVRVCILPKSTSSWGGSNPNPQSGQWTRFKTWAEPKKSKHLIIQTYNPEKIPTDIVLEVYIFQNQSRTTWTQLVEDSVNEYFRRKRGILGRKLEPSDLDDLCKYDTKSGKRIKREGLDYVRVLEPTKPIEPKTMLEYVTPRNISIVVKYTERKEQ